MLGVTVAGGTGAGRRIVKPLPVWVCACPRTHLGERYSCPDCGGRRPS